jgi:hypothetical protein
MIDIGILSGFGGVTGMALSLPFTYNHNVPTALVSNYQGLVASTAEPGWLAKPSRIAPAAIVQSHKL